MIDWQAEYIRLAACVVRQCLEIEDMPAYRRKSDLTTSAGGVVRILRDHARIPTTDGKRSGRRAMDTGCPEVQP